jgi:hypothetical protein
MSYDLEGAIKVILDEQAFPSGFRKREFVVTTAEDRFPQDVKFELIKDKIELINDFQEGDNVKVSFDIRGNEYKGRYFVNLAAWRIQKAGEPGGEEPEARRDQGRPEPEDTHDYSADEDVPF